MLRSTLILTALWCSICWVSEVLAQPADIYVIDAPNFGQPPWQILKYDDDGQNPEVFITEELAWPHDLVFLEDSDTVLVSNYNSGRINRYDADTGRFIDVFTSDVIAPSRMKIGADNLLYVAQDGISGRVRRFELDGTTVDDFTNTDLPRILGFDWDRDGNFYVGSYDAQLVALYSPDGIDQGNFIQSNLAGPSNIWFAGSGDLLVIDYDAGVVQQFAPSGAYKGVAISGLSQSEGVDFLPNGNVLIGNGGTSSVKMFSPEGVYIEDIIPSQSGGLSRPNAVVVRQDPDWEFSINAGLNDAWYYPVTAGQGFLITVFPDIQQMFVAWFTYDTVRPPDDVTAQLGGPGQRWLTAQGPYDGQVAELTIYVTTGGVFDSAQPQATTDQAGDGSMVIEFRDCESGLVSYNITSLGISGSIPIQRTAKDNVALCEALSVSGAGDEVLK